MNSILNRSDEVSRRRFLHGAASTFLGVGLLPVAHNLLSGSAFAAGEGTSPLKQIPTAKRVIYLYMGGGMTHLDTFDLKPGAETQGPTQAIKSSADGVRISEYLPKLARHMHHAAVINSLNSNTGAHEQANYLMHTSYAMRGTIKHPNIGAWLLKFQGRSNETLPGSVVIGGGGRTSSGGFFEPPFHPLTIGNPEAGLQNSKTKMASDEFEHRLGLSRQIGNQFRQRYGKGGADAYTDMYDDAVRLMKSKDLEAFDLSQEPTALREAYGDNQFGQGCLLARRLVENGIRFVEVQLGGWDTHQANFIRVPERCDTLDRGMSNLLADLEVRGLLDDTLVVLTTEFGRTPRINQNVGRDHYPKAFSSVLAGGGIKGGQTYGKTDATGEEVIENKVSPEDFNATIAYALGLPLDHVLYSPSKRPFTVAHKGKPITQIFG